jgi:hypothetical protein
MVLRDVVSLLGFTWLLSLPMWGSMWTGKHAPYTILRSVAVRRGDKASCPVLPYSITPQWEVVPFQGL